MPVSIIFKFIDISWELYKDVACCFDQILEAASYKKTIDWPLPSHHTNHSSKMNKACWALLENQGQTHKWCFPMESNIWTHSCWPTSKNLHSSPLCRHRIQSRWFIKNDDWQGWVYIYIYISRTTTIIITITLTCQGFQIAFNWQTMIKQAVIQYSSCNNTKLELYLFSNISMPTLAHKS